MKDRPILFSSAMVRALLHGTKTQTRRLVKDLPPWEITEICEDSGGSGKWMPNGPSPSGKGMAAGHWRLCPYGQTGDRLWVQEAFALSVVDPDGLAPEDDPENWDVIYKADAEQPSGGWTDGKGSRIPAPWQRDASMPRWASRILLEIISVRAERLNDISEADALAEGIDQDTLAERQDSYDIVCKGTEASGRATATSMFRELWESINGADSWGANPWVWVVEFKRVTS